VIAQIHRIHWCDDDLHFMDLFLVKQSIGIEIHFTTLCDNNTNAEILGLNVVKIFLFLQ